MYIARHVRFDETTFPFRSSSPQPPVSPTTILLSIRPTFVPPSGLASPDPLGSPPAACWSEPSSTDLAENPSAAPADSLSSLTPSSSHVLSSMSSQLDSSNSVSPAPSPPPARTHPMTLRSNPKPKVLFSPSASLTTIPSTTSDVEPTSFTIANKSVQWRQAMADEYHDLLRNGTLSLVPLTASMNVVGCRWVYKIKRKADGSIECYKMRLVAKGFHQ